MKRQECEECDGQVRHDTTQGNRVCIECGLIAAQRMPDQGRERVFAEDG